MLVGVMTNTSGFTAWNDMTVMSKQEVEKIPWHTHLRYSWDSHIWGNFQTLKKKKGMQVWVKVETFVLHLVKLKESPQFIQWPHQMWRCIFYTLQHELITGNVWLEQTQAIRYSLSRDARRSVTSKGNGVIICIKRGWVNCVCWCRCRSLIGQNPKTVW